MAKANYTEEHVRKEARVLSTKEGPKIVVLCGDRYFCFHYPRTAYEDERVVARYVDGAEVPLDCARYAMRRALEEVSALFPLEGGPGTIARRALELERSANGMSS